MGEREFPRTEMLSTGVFTFVYFRHIVPNYIFLVLLYISSTRLIL